GCDGGNREILRHRRYLFAPWRGLGDLHTGQQTPLWVGQLGLSAIGLGDVLFVATTCAQQQCQAQGGQRADVVHLAPLERRLVSRRPVATHGSKVATTERIRPLSIAAQASLACSRELTKPNTQVASSSKK